MGSQRPSKDLLERSASQMRELFDDGSPGVLRGLGPLFTAEEVFEWIKQAHPRARANTSRDKIIALKQSWGLSPSVPPEGALADPGRPAEIYRSGCLVLDPSPFLPTPDEDFAAWIERARGQLGGEFGMQAPGLECASWDAWERLHALLAPVLALTGPRTYRFNAFLGDYRVTPFRFHLDPHQEAVFQYVLTGRRRGYFWEGLTLSEDIDAAWVEDSNDLHPVAREPDAVIDLEPGDLVFWPGTQVHGFEAEGPSLALSMVIDRASPRRKEDVVSSLEIATVTGRTAQPAIDEHAAVRPEQVLYRRRTAGLAYERFDDTLIVGVCGRTFEWPDLASIPVAMQLFDQLISSERSIAHEIVSAHASELLDADDILGVLSMLVGLGYLRPA
ncbi:MAG: hypothetical protein R6X02_09220 [Enhygromyxa sp.]